jgi:hypothetical protein
LSFFGVGVSYKKYIITIFRGIYMFKKFLVLSTLCINVVSVVSAMDPKAEQEKQEVYALLRDLDKDQSITQMPHDFQNYFKKVIAEQARCQESGDESLLCKARRYEFIAAFGLGIVRSACATGSHMGPEFEARMTANSLEYAQLYNTQDDQLLRVKYLQDKLETCSSLVEEAKNNPNLDEDEKRGLEELYGKVKSHFNELEKLGLQLKEEKK